MKNFSYLFVALLFLAACSAGGAISSSSIKKTNTGFKYQMHAANDGPKAQFGDHLTLNMLYSIDKTDSILFNTFKNPQPLNFQYNKSLFKGALNEGFNMLAAGDSASFWVPASKIYGERLPVNMTAEDELKYTVKLMKIQSKEEMEAERKKVEEAAKSENMKQLKDYFAKNNIKAQSLESGLHYVVDKAGSGENPKAGQTVKVHYTGTLLDGTKFDSSVDRGQPFEFPLGQGRVIKGWDTGIPLFKKGGKGTLYIPSHLGYGSRGAGANIPPNAVLVFEIELLDFK